jgi:hypothetical protein
MTAPYSREWQEVTEEDREAANESIRLALLDTPDSHPDATALGRVINQERE